MKRLLAALVTLVFIVGVFPMSITAEESYDDYYDDYYTHPFADVPNDSWYADAVEYCYYYDIVSGTSDTTFSPNMKLTRAMFVTMLARMSNADLGEYTESSFADVKVGSWYAPAVEWAYRNNVTSGTGEGEFSPDALITREQICCLFYNFIVAKIGEDPGYISTEYLDEYVDADNISSWAKEGVAFAVECGIMSSTSTEVLRADPKMQVTRAQAAQFSYNFHWIFEYYICEHNWLPATCTEPSCCENCGYYDDTTVPNGHNTQNGVCVECGREAKSDIFEQVTEAVKEKSEYYGGYEYSMYMGNVETSIVADPVWDQIRFDRIIETEDVYSWITIYVDDVSNVYCYDISYESGYDENTGDYANSYYLDGTIELPGGYVDFNYDSYYIYPTDVEDYIIDELNALISDTDYLLYNLCGVSISDFGF